MELESKGSQVHVAKQVLPERKACKGPRDGVVTLAHLECAAHLVHLGFEVMWGYEALKVLLANPVLRENPEKQVCEVRRVLLALRAQSERPVSQVRQGFRDRRAPQEHVDMMGHLGLKGSEG